jgi:hypothetical protein
MSFANWPKRKCEEADRADAEGKGLDRASKIVGRLPDSIAEADDVSLLGAVW